MLKGINEGIPLQFILVLFWAALIFYAEILGSVLKRSFDCCSLVPMLLCYSLGPPAFEFAKGQSINADITMFFDAGQCRKSEIGPI